MATLDQLTGQSKQFYGSLAPKQRLMLVGGVLITAAVLVFFARTMATPEYRVLMTGMEGSDAQSLASRLAAKNIPYQISTDGKTVSVPGDKLDSSRLEIAAEGMPHSGRMGFELFDKLNWGQTEFDEKVNYQRALEGELERTIQTLRDVDSVRVHIVMPTESVFLDRERPAKASVIIRARSGQLSDDTQRAIAGLVSGAVDNLNRDNVTVIDADTNRPMISHGRRLSGSDEDLETELSNRLVATLEPVVGPQRVRASVNVEYDPSTSEENQETYDPKSAVAVSVQRSEEQVDGGGLGGVPGTTSNVPGSNSGAKPAVDESGDGGQTSKTENSTYAVDKLVRHTLQPAGRIRRLSAALIVDDAIESKVENGRYTEVRRKRSADEMKQIEQLAEAAIGLDTKRGDTLAVQNLSFQQPAQSTIEPISKTQKLRLILNDWSMVVRYGALTIMFLLAYIFLLRPIKRQTLATLQQLPATAAAKQEQQKSAKELEGMPAELRTLPEEQRRTLGQQKQVIERVKAEPVVAGQLIQSWLREV